MNRIYEIIITSLRSVICADENALKNIGEIDTETLQEVYNLAKKHDMAHLVGVALEKKGALDIDKSIKEKFAKEQYVAIYRYENIRYEINRISSLFEREHIQYVKLKGAAIRDLYPEPWMRTSCDIDILIHENDIEKASDLLVKELNYRREGEKHFHDVWFYSESGIHLELHFNIKETIDCLDRVLEQIWEYTTDTDSSCREMREEFLVYHLIAHTAYHFIGGGCGIRPFVDIYFLKEKLKYDEKAVLELCEKSKIEKFYSEVLSLSDVWFGDGTNSSLTERMEMYICDGGTYGTKEAHIAVLQETRGGKSGYVRSRVFVSYEHLKQRYPSLKNRAFKPIYQIRRWVDVIKEGKSKSVIRELKINHSLSDERAKSVFELMSDLELDKYIK